MTTTFDVTSYSDIVRALLACEVGASTAADLALLLSYHADRDDDAVFGVLNAAIAQMVANVRAPISSVGIFHPPNSDAWVLAHIGDDDLVQELRSFDERLLGLLRDTSISLDHGLRRGLAGAGSYALERWRRGDHGVAAEIMSAVVTRLRKLASHDDRGCYWTTGYDYATDRLDPRLSTGYQNLGVLHGGTGTVAVLGAIAETGVIACGDLVADGARWLLAQFAHDDLHGSRLANVTGMPELTNSYTAAWCRGDIGALAALWNGLRRAGLDEAALMPHVEHVLARERTLPSALDGALCHGAAGIAQVLYRFHLATGREEFLEASRARLAQAKAFYNPSLQFGGYGLWNRQPDEAEFSWKASATFLEGSVGVALAMQSQWLGEEPAWDRWLAIDIPPR